MQCVVPVKEHPLHRCWAWPNIKFFPPVLLSRMRCHSECTPLLEGQVLTRKPVELVGGTDALMGSGSCQSECNRAAEPVGDMYMCVFVYACMFCVFVMDIVNRLLQW